MAGLQLSCYLQQAECIAHLVKCAAHLVRHCAFDQMLLLL